MINKKSIILLIVLLSSISNYSRETLKFYTLYGLSLSAIEVTSSDVTARPNDYFLDNILMTITPHSPLSSGNWGKYLSFYKGGETMTIDCRACGYSSKNFFIKNMIFKSGYYILTYNPPMYLNEKTGSYNSKIVYTKGENLDVPENIKNTRIQYITLLDGMINGRQEIFSDQLFRGFQFIEVDLKDTTALNLREMTKGEVEEYLK